MSNSVTSNTLSVSSNLSAQLAGYENNNDHIIPVSEAFSNFDETIDKINKFSSKVSLGDESYGLIEGEHDEIQSNLPPPSGIEPDCCSLVGSFVSCRSGLMTRSTSTQQLPDLSSSPMTASSYTTLERQYDMDTWRMHNRIAGSRFVRSERMKDELNLSHNVVSTKMPIQYHGIHIEVETEDEDEDVLEIFDLDL